ncbi:TadE/TadG family type IV pilus assembly protein [Brucella gallinifaecis]|uniref:TadE/TadG family type IV pilus assembly protein n=1 Tax=Brucella gallinifaecis TaxID=215590 RepID=UPI00130DE75C|nr:Tad domain-containing protein [Brucella gallinifaecis]
MKNFIKDNNGSAAITTAILIGVLCVASGSAIEITRIVTYKSELQHAADSAVLAAISDSSKAARIWREQATTQHMRIPEGDIELTDYFEQNFPKNDVLIMEKNQVEPRVEIKNQILQSDLTYNAKLKSYFSGILGYDSFELSGHAQARRLIQINESKTDTPFDLYFFLDNSPSMGIGLTRDDIHALQKYPVWGTNNGGCGFACHFRPEESPSEWTPSELPNLRKRLPPVTLRIDDLKKSFIHEIERIEAESHLSKKNPVNIAAYSFPEEDSLKGGNPDDIRKLFDLSDNYTNILKNIKTESYLSLMKVGIEAQCINQSCDYEGNCTPCIPGTKGYTIGPRYNSNLPEAMRVIEKDILSNKTDRKKAMIIITDGFANYDMKDKDKCYQSVSVRPQRTIPLGTCVGPINLELCEEIKKKGILIGTVQTEYVPELKNADDEFEKIVIPQAEMVSDYLAKCASPGLSYKTNFGLSVTENLTRVVDKLIRRVKLVE